MVLEEQDVWHHGEDGEEDADAAQDGRPRARREAEAASPYQNHLAAGYLWRIICPDFDYYWQMSSSCLGILSTEAEFSDGNRMLLL